MKNIWHSRWLQNAVLYFLIALLPSAILSSLFIKHQSDKRTEYLLHESEKHAGLHALNIERFVGETIGSLEMLAMLLKLQPMPMEAMERLLIETQKKDKRFSGFYWVDASGDIVLSTNPLSQNVSLKDREYVKKAIQSRKTQISEAHKGRVTGRQVVSIATPVILNQRVEGILIGSLRLDYMKEFIKRMTREEIIELKDANEQVLFVTEDLADRQNWISASLPAGRIPWEVTAHLSSMDEKWLQTEWIKYILVSLVVTHILFGMAQYYMIRRRMKWEKQQNEAQKLELIGSLAASTAHEIRNPLTGIKGLTALLSEKHQEEKDQFYFSVIQQEIDRINAIVSELLVLGKPTIHQTRNYEMQSIIQEIIPIIHSEANLYNVEVNVTTDGKPAFIHCSKDHIKQVLLNITKNALEAMPNGGKLHIFLKTDLHHATITIQDTGKGISEELLNHIFDPFYTNKKNGTGLGLVVCRRILDMYGGAIQIYSRPNEGTKAVIQIPLSDEKQSK